MDFSITFISDRKSEVFNDVKRFMLLNNIIVLVFNDNSEQSLTDVLGITPYYYNEG